MNDIKVTDVEEHRDGSATLQVECAPDTQAETQEVAWAISLKMEDLFPVSWVALRDEY